MSRISRRAFIGGGVAVGVGFGVGIPFAMGLSTPTSTGNQLRTMRPLPRLFSQRLRIPPQLQPVRTDETADYYRMTHTAAMASILPGVKTPIWGFNGIFPGPTVVSRRARKTVIEHTNDLPVQTVVHLHGGRTPHDSDGYPIDYIYPRDMSYLNRQMNMDHSDMSMAVGDVTHGSRTYTYPLDQRAATLWYHDHRMDFTGPSVWRGLAGFHIVRDDEEDALGLPRVPASCLS